MITLSNGHVIKYLAASGALAFDGLGWLWEWPMRWLGLLDPTLFTVVVKTLTRHPRKGNLRMWWPWRCIRFVHPRRASLPLWFQRLISCIPFGAVGVINAVGLTNPGIEYWCKSIWPRIRNSHRNIKLIISIFGEPEELVEMTEMINKLDDPDGIIVGIQINGACPNSGDNLLENASKVIDGCLRVAKISRFPISLSVSVAQFVRRIVQETEDVVEFYTINSVPRSWVEGPDRRLDCLVHLGGGGISGEIVQPITWNLAQTLEGLKVAVVWPSIWGMDDIAKMRKRGTVDAVSFGSIFLCHPLRPTRIVRQDMKAQSN